MEQLQPYEFNETQNHLIRDLSSKMRFISYFSIGLGVLGIVAGILVALRASGGIGGIIQGTIFVITGIWTIRAASYFQTIVKTQGNDIENLMAALEELRKLYTLQYWLLILGLIFFILLLVLVLFSGSVYA